MNNIWSLGEGYGQRGTGLAVHELQCPFCLEQGNFELEHRAVKKKPNSDKKLNFDTYRCGNCVGYVMALWSASEHGGLYNFRVLPSVTGKLKAPDYWPSEIQRFWSQAHESVTNEIWDGAAVLIRSALQICLRVNGAAGDNLRDEINDLAQKGILPPLMKEWSNELRFLGNDSAHPEVGQESAAPIDVKDALEFLDYLLQYLYDLPKQINDFRGRKI